MSGPDVARFRTLGAAVLAILALVFGLWLVAAGDRGDAFFAFGGSLVGVVVAVAGKSSVDALAGGGGLRGAGAALMSAAKPGDPPKPPGGGA
jgi:hypothetical protein